MILTRELATPVGILAAGNWVTPVTQTETTVTVRVPRMGAISWTLTVPCDAVTGEDTLRRHCLICSGITFTDVCAGCRAYRQKALRTTA